MKRSTTTRREVLQRLAAAGGWAVASGFQRQGAGPERQDRPNIVIILTDDQGYADVGCYGAQGYQTPNLDRMAAEGRRFTDYHVAQAVCSASRASLLTGCYPNRIGILGALGPKSRNGISDAETTIGEMAKRRGYATAAFGKWHLGHHPQFLPARHGFDEYFGLPYSNDMWPRHPEDKSYPPLPLIDGTRIVARDPDQTQLTKWYTERAVSFIERHRDKPFLLYVAHSMPHVPLHVSEKFKGHSKSGLYGDVIMEIDWSVGRIFETIKRLSLDRNTLVVFVSDNGPWLSYGDHAGSAGAFREGKGTTWEGGLRVPCIVRWPGKIPEGTVCAEAAMNIDIFPTVARIIGSQLPALPIDGLDIWPLMSGQPDARTPHEALFFYWNRKLEAVRSGQWKLHFPHAYMSLAGQKGGSGGTPSKYTKAQTGVALYDLQADPGEKTNLVDEHPEIVTSLLKLADKAREELGDGDTPGKGCRPAGMI
ncbi:MAG: arylsulfatase [Acidobacteria bacterium]|nr:MAG: arylsulfatase [Acidobacteriota bacterium]